MDPCGRSLQAHQAWLRTLTHVQAALTSVDTRYPMGEFRHSCCAGFCRVAFFLPLNRADQPTKPLSPFHRHVGRRRDGREDARDSSSGKAAGTDDDAGLRDRFTNAFTTRTSGHEAAAAATSTSFLRTIVLCAATHGTQRSVERQEAERFIRDSRIPPRFFSPPPHCFIFRGASSGDVRGEGVTGRRWTGKLICCEQRVWLDVLFALRVCEAPG